MSPCSKTSIRLLESRLHSKNALDYPFLAVDLSHDIFDTGIILRVIAVRLGR